MKLKYEDHEKLTGQLSELHLEAESLKTDLIDQWRNNIDFVNGNQVVYWDYKVGQFRTKVLPAKQKLSSSDYIYVTNELAPINRVITSFMTRNRPSVRVFPADHNNDFSNRRARVADNYLWAKWEMDREYAVLVEMIQWSLACGSVFRKDHWVSGAGGTRSITEEERESRRIISPNGFDQDAFGAEVERIAKAGAPQREPDEDSQDESQEDPQEETTHWGDSAVSVATGFNISVDFNTKNEHADWFEESSLQEVDWVKENYSKKDQFYTGRAHEIKETDDFGKALEIDLALRFKVHSEAGKKPKTKGLCLFSEFYQAPKPYMPWNRGSNKQMGALVVMANNKIPLYIGPSPYRKWHPYTRFNYEDYLGRYWGKSLWEQLIPLQCRLNELNGAIVKNAKTLAKGKWMILEGTINEGDLSGAEDKPLFFKKDPTAGVVIPQIQSGMPLPAQFFNERQLIIEQMARIAATNMIMSGQAPTGVSAASALQLLLESANSQYGTIINNWEKMIEYSQTNKLILFQDFCRQSREDVFKMLKQKERDTTSLDIECFCGDYIEDGVSVEVEAGSSIPKSQAARQAQLMEFGKSGILGDLNDPPTRHQFLKEFGITEFDKTNNIELEKVNWENSRMLKGQPPSPSEDDIHALHLPKHISETQRPSYIEGASNQTRQLYAEHIAWHKEQQAQAAQAAKQGQMAEMSSVAQADAQLAMQKDKNKAEANSEAKNKETGFKHILQTNPEILQEQLLAANAGNLQQQPVLPT